MSIDAFDLKILMLLQRDASLTNAELAARVHLSASQCSRRRQGLEAAGYIRAYRADLDGRKLGFAVEAFTRVTLAAHGKDSAESFATLIKRLDAVQQAHTITGDADYLLHIRARSLEDLAAIIHTQIQPHPHVSQVRSDIVLTTLKDNQGFGPLGAGS